MTLSLFGKLHSLMISTIDSGSKGWGSSSRRGLWWCSWRGTFFYDIVVLNARAGYENANLASSNNLSSLMW